MINVQRLCFSFRQRELFRDLSFRLPRGKIGAVLGPNGRGKTTLLRLLPGILRSNAGEIQLGAHAAYVPQFSQTAFNYSVETMVSLGRIRHLPWYASPGSADRKIVAQCLDYLHLTPRAGQAFNQLSGGEKQIVMMAQALASEPQILLLDEPTSALDLHNQDLILTLLRELAATRDITILFTSHYPQHALHVADYVLLLSDTHKYAWGEAREVVTEAALETLYQLPVAIRDIHHERGAAQAVVPLFR